MLSIEKITTQQEMGNLISKMNEEGYIFVREKNKNSDGTIVLEFKQKDSRQILTE